MKRGRSSLVKGGGSLLVKRGRSSLVEGSGSLSVMRGRSSLVEGSGLSSVGGNSLLLVEGGSSLLVGVRRDKRPNSPRLRIPGTLYLPVEGVLCEGIVLFSLE